MIGSSFNLQFKWKYQLGHAIVINFMSIIVFINDRNDSPFIGAFVIADKAFYFGADFTSINVVKQ